MVIPARRLRSEWVVAGVLVVLGTVAGCTSSVDGAPVQGSTRPPVGNSVSGTDWTTVGSPAGTAPSTRSSSETRSTTLPPAGATSAPTPGTVVPESGITTSRSARRTVGDLALTEKISTVACDGEWIVLLGSAVNPKTYAADVQHLLQVHPGSHYLRTDQACTSLNQRTDAGDHIYAVYFGPHDSIDKACQVLGLTGPDAQVRKLADTAEPLGPEKC